MSRILLVIIIFFQGIYFLSEARNISDSLLLKLKNTKDPVTKTKLLIRLGSETRNISPRKSREYCLEAISMAEKNGDSISVGSAANILGVALYRLGNYPEALQMLNRSLRIRIAAGDSTGVGNTSINIGNLFIDQGDYPKALSFHLRGLRIHEANRDETGISQSLNNIGIIHSSMGDYAKALQIHKKTLALREKLNDEIGVATSSNNIAIVYYSERKFDEAILWMERAMELRKKLRDYPGLSTTLMNMGAIYSEQGKYDDAIKTFLEAEKVQHKMQSRSDLSAIYYNIGITYEHKGDFQNALRFHKKALSVAKETGNKEELMNSWDGLYITWKALGNYQKALESLENSTAYKDSIFNDEKAAAVAEIQTRYEVEKKEQAIELLNQTTEIQKLQIINHNYWIWGLSGGLGILGIFTLIFINHVKLKNRQQTVELQQKLLRSQMNPHFIFNSLAAIQTYIVSHEPREAARFLASFSKLVRQILENSREEYISFDKEISTMKNYLQLQQLRFPGLFTYEIEIGTGINEEFAQIPPMLMQPFIENAIEHGLPRIVPGIGTILIRYKREGETLSCEVTDNGIGIEHSQKNRGKDHGSLAIKITKERLALLNKKRGKKIILEIEDLGKAGKNQGTRVIFTLPYKETE